MPKNSKRKLIGEISVDAGLCWLGDPSYILHTAQKRKSLGKDWGEFCDALHEGEVFWQFHHDLGHPGLGVVISTGFGDGVYPVYAQFTPEGLIAKVWVEFIDD